MKIPFHFSIKWLFVLSALSIWAVVFLTIGPTIEMKLFPPVRINITAPVVEQNADDTGFHLSFYLEGEKYRDCPINTISAAWVFIDGSTVPVDLVRPEGTRIERDEPALLYAAGDTFYRGPFSVDVVSQLQDTTRLRIISTYQCTFLWELKSIVWLTFGDVDHSMLPTPSHGSASSALCRIPMYVPSFIQQVATGNY